MTPIGDLLNSILSEGSDARSSSRPLETSRADRAHDDPQKVEAEVRRLWSVLRRTAAISATLNYERVLDMALDLGLAALSDPNNGSSDIVGVLYLFDDDQLYAASARGLTQADWRVHLPGKNGVLGQSLESTEARVLDNPSDDPELKHIAALHRCQQVISIPLGVGLEIYGALLFGHPQMGFFDQPDRLELLEVSAQQAMIALQNARLYRELEQEKERISEIQEEARKKLARDLHDGPTQSISAIGMRVNFARRLLDRDPKAASDELYKIEELARRTTKEMRQMLFTLRPLVLESDGLVPAFEHLAEKVRETHDQRVIVEAEQGVADDLEVGKQGVLFFIVEEAVNNARKHAQAERIWIRLRRQKETLLLEIADDGKGFDLSEVESDYEKRGSLGMVNLRERAELVNGILKIDSSPGDGTEVRVLVPLSVEAAEKLHRAGFAA
ncbi:MAG: GAF domain-containing sensor histidine kinase [Anaerolineales bacterium]